MTKFDMIMGLIAKFDLTSGGRNVYIHRYENREDKKVGYEFSLINLQENSDVGNATFEVYRIGKEYHFRLNGIQDDTFDEGELRVIFEELEKTHDTYLQEKLKEAWMALGVIF